MTSISGASGWCSPINPLKTAPLHIAVRLSNLSPFCGIVALQKTLPSLIREIDANLSTRERDLKRLGRPREEAEDLRVYLLDIARSFERLVRDGVEGRYSNEFFGGLYDGHEVRKLRARIRRLNTAFYVTLVTKGVDRKIQWSDGRHSFQEENIPWMLDEDEEIPEYLVPYLEFFQEFPEPQVVEEGNLHHELEQLAATNQGTEFPGLPNGDLGFQLFRMQVRPWARIAESYLDQITMFARSFVEELITHVIGSDKRTTRAIQGNYVDVFFENKHAMLRDKLQEILRPYAEAYVPPIDFEFHSAVLSRTTKRQAERVADVLEENFPVLFIDRGGRSITRDQVEHVFASVETSPHSEFGIEKIVDMTETHFQISLRAFAQNVVNLVAENCLISDLHSILIPSLFVRMDEDRLKELASESEDIRVQKATLQHKISILREGLLKCRHSRTS
ncbi:hypothetical protein F5B22DRAFT_644515 [Xylaria bambusicola]|uniref:uncharacterized protein n=1 Tax=Xylaria bambusicola TaxID=326684 RepID=UPI0020088B4D|nr:uncharacterized protein F5B22DRAFT_644515 [Xylaria bambusicola]KAI0520771.1 hypothetical protein F5B22DRAFT_644515 [Xylaria bambusicola]